MSAMKTTTNLSKKGQDLVHVVHEHNRSIGQTKVHNHILVMTISGSEGRLMYIISLY